VVAFEMTLPGYAPARLPATADEAAQFKTKLLQRLIDDATTLEAQWQPAAIDIGAAFQGLVALMNEQREKVNKAATGEEESRYAQVTLFDLRNNLEGTSKIYDVFRPWVTSKTSTVSASDGPTCDKRIASGFDALRALYGGYTGDAVPAPPPTWSSDTPTQADLQTPFGKLWSSVQSAVDPNANGSVVFEMNDVATILGFPQFIEGK
jgi:iron uptake system component EfeO